MRENLRARLQVDVSMSQEERYVNLYQLNYSMLLILQFSLILAMGLSLSHEHITPGFLFVLFIRLFSPIITVSLRLCHENITPQVTFDGATIRARPASHHSG